MTDAVFQTFLSDPVHDSQETKFNEMDQIHDPNEAISRLLNHIGGTFGCDRIYIMERTDTGSYSCSHEWTASDIVGKKHLLQNIEEHGVRFYYSYFLRGKNLLFKDIHELKETDPALYKILKPQDLTSCLCAQLLIDEHDAGFIGFDNPSPDKYDELESMLEVLRFFVSSRIHQRNLDLQLRAKTISASGDTPQTGEISLYQRIAQIIPDEYFAIIYFDGSLKYEDISPDSDVMCKVVSCCRNVLCRIFGEINVFHVTGAEFLIFFDNSSDKDIDSLSYYVSMARKTFESMNIVTAIGYASIRHYHEDFFELVQIANIRMLRNKQEYRRLFMGKYHLPSSPAFHDLVEIHPKSGTYQVLFSEYVDHTDKTGNIRSALNALRKMVIPSEQVKYDRFMQAILSPYMDKERNLDRMPSFSDTFTVHRKGKAVVLQLHITSYFNVEEELVYMVYTI